MKTLSGISVFLLTLFMFAGTGHAQAPKVKIAELGWPMPDFTLTAFQGGDYSISGLKGKNILLVFSRGRVQDSVTWCNICQYQYAELADLEKTEQIRKKYNLEILFVLPYDKKEVADWVSSFPKQLAEVESWKNPPDSLKKNDGVMKWAEKAKVLFPKKFDYKEGSVSLPLPVLVDADRKVSKSLDLFRMEWDRSKVAQNIPTIFIIDSEGNLRFKYISQKTTDRPNAAYLLKFIGDFMMKK